MKVYDLAMPILQLISNGEVAMMALFTAYIDDYLGFEIFCNDLPLELFYILRGNIAESQDLRDALKDSGIIEQGLELYMDRAFEDCHMLYHFMDGEDAILKDPFLVDLLSSDDRYMLKDILKRWREGEINELNWEDIFTAICEERNSKIS